MTTTETNQEEASQSDGQAQANDYISNRTFADFPISTETLNGIRDRQYEVATAVQAATQGGRAGCEAWKMAAVFCRDVHKEIGHPSQQGCFYGVF